MNLTQPLIGVGGHLRSGKDTFADFLVANHGYVKLGMSDALHEAMMVLDPIIQEGANRHAPIRYSSAIESLGYVRAKEVYPEIRTLLQRLGTEVGRNMFGENVWVNIMARKIDDHRGAGHPVVVTGIRFPNELQMVNELAGWSVWVDRAIAGNEFTPGHEMNLFQHESENSVRQSDFDCVISNNSTLIDLGEKAAVIASDVAVFGGEE